MDPGDVIASTGVVEEVTALRVCGGVEASETVYSTKIFLFAFADVTV
jgi:hypothetical protein